MFMCFTAWAEMLVPRICIPRQSSFLSSALLFWQICRKRVWACIRPLLRQICRQTMLSSNADKGLPLRVHLVWQICRQTMLGRSADQGLMLRLHLVRQICRQTMLGRSADKGLPLGVHLVRHCVSSLFGRSADKPCFEPVRQICRPTVLHPIQKICRSEMCFFMRGAPLKEGGGCL